MANSSDEDFNSSDEEIDLEALWRDPPFLSDDESEEEVEVKEEDDKPIVIELMPISSIVEKEDKPYCPILDSLNEINSLTDRISFGANETEQAIRYASRLQAARQRILTVGSPLAEETSGLLRQQPTFTPPPSRPGVIGQPVRANVPLRVNQLRSSTLTRTSTTPTLINRPQTNTVRISNPRFAIRRQMLNQTNGPVNSNLNMSVSGNNTSGQPHALGTIKEREKHDALPISELLALFRPDQSSDKESSSESSTSLSSDSSLSD